MDDMTGNQQVADLKLFATLPVVLRFLRVERGAETEELEAALGLTSGLYGFMELGLTPSLGILDRILVYFDLNLSTLDRRLKAMEGVRWPPGTLREQMAREAAAQRADRAPSLTTENFNRASEVIRDFEYRDFVSPERWRPAEHGFESFAEALRWLRGFLRLDEAELAKMADVKPLTIRVLEAGKRQPTKDTRFAIGRFVQPTYNDLLANAGALGARPCWDPPRREVYEDRMQREPTT